ncbi:transposase [Bifidobacterium longum subsp. longum]|nr:transposase [Bifidobacterium longum subsp. longum]
MEAIGIDGTGRRGRSCITVVADLVEHDVTDVTPGRAPATVERFARDFMDHNGVPVYVRLVACGMSPGFRKGIREHLPHARRIVDRFHVARHADEAVDKAGKTEGRSDPLLKRTEYLWLGNGESPTELQVEAKRNLTGQRLKTGRACRMREVLCVCSIEVRPMQRNYSVRKSGRN